MESFPQDKYCTNMGELIFLGPQTKDMRQWPTLITLGTYNGERCIIFCHKLLRSTETNQRVELRIKILQGIILFRRVYTVS